MDERIRGLLRQGLAARDRPSFDLLLMQLIVAEGAPADEVMGVMLEELAIADQATKDYWNGPCECGATDCAHLN